MDVAAALPPGALGVRAYAKVNLHLEVLGRRPDGYHEVETVLQSIGLYDVLHLVPRPHGVSILCDAPGVPADEENLCMRAARALLAAVGRTDPPHGVRIDLYKNIPVAAGFGGGSADAAATLIGLDRFWGLDVGTEELLRIATELGTDVPFCIGGGTALGRGRGNVLTALPPIHRTWFLIVFPGLRISSAWAYEHLGMGLTRRSHTLSMSRLRTILTRYPEAARGLFNRLEDAVCAAQPQVGEIASRLLQLGASAAMMSGSGSGVFGAFRTEAEAIRARREFGRTDWRMPIVPSIERGVEVLGA
jgi:4-diphosphocytidyl-2-C-methyl-D-erythritol kinase